MTLLRGFPLKLSSVIPLNSSDSNENVKSSVPTANCRKRTKAPPNVACPIFLNDSYSNVTSLHHRNITATLHRCITEILQQSYKLICKYHIK